MVRGLVLASLAFALPLAGSDLDEPLIGDRGDGDQYFVDAYKAHQDSGTAHEASSSSTDGPPIEYARAPACGTSRVRSDLSLACPGNDEIVETCLDGSNATDPLWSRTQQDTGVWGDWSVVSWYSCPTDAPLLAAIEHEWTQLQPEPSSIQLQPNTGWVIATVPTIAMADDEPRLHAAVLLGADVDIRATASGYVWHWGDGSTTATTDPGRPFPNATLTHTYAHSSGGAEVSLTTTWAGEFRVNDGAWQTFDTTIESASPAVDLAIYDPRSRLVNCDLAGSCRVETHG